MQTTQQRQLDEPRTILSVSLMALVFAIGTALGAIIDIRPTVSSAATVPVGDRSYDAVEETPRGPRPVGPGR